MSSTKDNPADVARVGFDAMMRGATSRSEQSTRSERKENEH